MKGKKCDLQLQENFFSEKIITNTNGRNYLYFQIPKSPVDCSLVWRLDLDLISQLAASVEDSQSPDVLITAQVRFYVTGYKTVWKYMNDAEHSVFELKGQVLFHTYVRMCKNTEFTELMRL